jgi:hypothetical protein
VHYRSKRVTELRSTANEISMRLPPKAVFSRRTVQCSELPPDAKGQWGEKICTTLGPSQTSDLNLSAE